MRISDWSSDVCSSDLHPCQALAFQQLDPAVLAAVVDVDHFGKADLCADDREAEGDVLHPRALAARPWKEVADQAARAIVQPEDCPQLRSEEHTSELQSLMRISYAVFCLKKKQKKTENRSPRENKTKIRSTDKVSKMRRTKD